MLIPNSVTTIGERAFDGNQITTITIGANVEVVSTAFDGNFVAQYNSVYYDWYTNRNLYRRSAGTYILRNNSWSLR